MVGNGYVMNVGRGYVNPEQSVPGGYAHVPGGYNWNPGGYAMFLEVMLMFLEVIKCSWRLYNVPGGYTNKDRYRAARAAKN